MPTCSITYRNFAVVGFRVVAASLMLLASQTSLSAAIWTNPAGGSFNTSGNWDTGVPGSGDTAAFYDSATYTVTFPTNVTNRIVEVNDGDVTFDLQGSTYLLLESSFGSFTFPAYISMAQDASDVSFLAVSDGAISLDGILDIGVNGSATLSISNGGSVSYANGNIGNNPGATGAVIVTGSNSTWINSGTLLVGRDGTGTLMVEAGGSASNINGFVGAESGSSGSATIRGVGSIWNHSGFLAIGNSGSGTLLIDAGGLVSNTSGNIGYFSGAGGMVTVTGSSSTWTSTSFLTVGRFGTGILMVEAGGSVSNANGHIGTEPGSNGTVTVTGFDSTWANSGLLNVGRSGTGTLLVDSGGSVSNTSGHIGLNSGSDGTVTVAGSGSTWTNSGFLRVASSGTGTLLIDSGGAVSNTDGNIGRFAGSDGSATVRGIGSTWNNSGSLLVGRLGEGTLLIEAGGLVSNDNGFIGAESGSSGSAMVRGIGTAWTNSGYLSIGHSGLESATGTLLIDSGGSVSNTSGHIGFNPEASGTVTVTGFDSTWTNSGFLDIGRFGKGTLVVETGGSVSNTNGYIGTKSGSNGTVAVTGFDSTWTNSDSLYVGGNSTTPGGSALLTVGIGATVDVANTLKIWNGGTVNLNGGTINASTIDVLGTLNFNLGTLNLIGADFTVGNAGILGPAVALQAGKAINSSGDAVVESFSSLTLTGGSFSTDGIMTNNGHIALTSSASSLIAGILFNNDLISGNGRIEAQLANAAGGRVFVNASDRLVISSPENTNSGEIELAGGTIDFNQQLTNNTTGQITGHGAFEFNGGLTNEGTIAFNGLSELSGDVTNNPGSSIAVTGSATVIFFDDLIHNGDEIRVDSGSTAIYFGSVSGSGQFTGRGMNLFEGDLLPGNSPGISSFAGDVAFSYGSTVAIEIGGMSGGQDYDMVQIARRATLDGTLEVTLVDDFLPLAGQSFEIMSYGARSGEFFTENLPALPGGLDWIVNYNSRSIELMVISAVPEPSSCMLIAVGLLALCCHRQNR